MTDTSREAVERWEMLHTYWPHGAYTMEIETDGSWVKYDDYTTLLSERDALRAQLQAARDEALEEAVHRIDSFLRCARIGMSEYIKGQDETAAYLRSEIRALKSTSAEREG